jgi:NAD-dependent dihydropyrimidine dehydrogenase PreA subunit
VGFLEARLLLLRTSMTYFIRRSCEGTCDTACVDVCPCDCIVGPASVEEIRARAPHDREGLQLFIDPHECIDCGACVPECPVDAIAHEAEVSPTDPDLLRNAAFFDDAR